MSNKFKTIFLLILAVMMLTSCGNNAEQDTVSEDTTTNEVIQSEEKQENSTKKSEYAVDKKNEKSSVDNHYNTYPETVELAEPYKYEIREQIIKEDIEIEDNDDTMIEDDIITEEIEDAEIYDIDTDIEEEAVPIEEVSELDKAKQEVVDIIGSIYYNGYSLLSGYKSVEDFNESHDIDMNSTISRIKRNLENIEYCDSLIKEYMSGYKNVVSSWSTLLVDLNNYQTILSYIESGEEYIEHDITRQCNLTESFNDFIEALSTV